VGRRTSAPGSKLSIIVAAVLATALGAVFVVNLNARLKSTGGYRGAYSGQVENKWITYHETLLGTSVSRHLLIKTRDGSMFTVSVGPEFYDRTIVNQWVVKDQNGLRVLADEPMQGEP
jgi:hypothetical protein